MTSVYYIGGGAYLPGVPARDLTADEADDAGGADYLIGTGLYSASQEPAGPEKPIEMTRAAGKRRVKESEA